MRMKKGSITLFLALMITCFFSAVFAFMEAGRVSGVKANAQLSTMQVRDTVLASYQRQLWQDYRLMFWQAEDGDIPGFTFLASLQEEAIEGNRADTLLADNYYVLPVHLTEVTVSDYQLASDDGGAAFRVEAEEMMKMNMASKVVDDLLTWLDGEDTDEGDDLEEQALDALDALENAEAAATEASSGDASGESAGDASGGSTSGTASSGVRIQENPLQWVKQVATNGVLTIVMPGQSVSSKAMDTSDSVSNRTLNTGTCEVTDDETTLQKAWFYIYLDEYFYDATESTADHALDYEVEYMIAGKDTDLANLKAVVRRLLLMREAANMLYLETDATKRSEVEAIAAVITTAAFVPEIEPLVEQGLLAAWAYAESLSDVRILLEGGKVSLVKTADQWHTDLASLSSTVMGTEGSEQTKGLTYSQYLQILMATVNTDKLTCRAMDIVEKNLDIRMDQMLAYAKCEYVYQSEPLFWNFVTLGSNTPGTYEFKDETEISFMDIDDE